MGRSCQFHQFLHSSSKAWRAPSTNKLTGKSEHSSRLWPVSANSIASQLVKKGAHNKEGPRVHKAREQRGVRHMDSPNN